MDFDDKKVTPCGRTQKTPVLKKTIGIPKNPRMFVKVNAHYLNLFVFLSWKRRTFFLNK